MGGITLLALTPYLLHRVRRESERDLERETGSERKRERVGGERGGVCEG
jgi:hypothetical protein